MQTLSGSVDYNVFSIQSLSLFLITYTKSVRNTPGIPLISLNCYFNAFFFVKYAALHEACYGTCIPPHSSQMRVKMSFSPVVFEHFGVTILMIQKS